MINNVLLVGRIVEKPKLNYFEKTTPVCTVTLALERSYRDKNNEKVTDFIPVTVWNSMSTFICKYLDKGDIVALKCRLRQKKLKLENTNIYTTEPICERVVLVSTKFKKDRSEVSPVEFDSAINDQNLNEEFIEDGILNSIHNPDEDFEAHYDDLPEDL